MAEPSFVAGPEAHQGEKISLPTLRLVVAALLGGGLVALLAWALAGRFRPGASIEPWVGGGLGGGTLALLIVVFLRPWRRQSRGVWSFAMLHTSMVSLVGVLVGFVLLYFSSGLDAVVLGLTAAGAWWIGFLATVFVFGRVAKTTTPGPDPSPE
ncbi:MAG: hypothetical protein ACYTF7_01505 [Planctomycetota bacterium]|jgi:hypothetical protein